MIVKFQYNKATEQGIKSHWILFKVKGVKYTKKVIDKVRNYLSTHINPNYAEVKDESIKGWYTGSYDDSCLSFNEQYNLYELRDKGSSSSNYKEYVAIVEI